jgi:mono/diheme cytochrome c family protein
MRGPSPSSRAAGRRWSTSSRKAGEEGAHDQDPVARLRRSRRDNVENGRRLFTDNVCYSCHATTGSGGGAGPKLAPNPLPLGAIINQLRHPNRMPPYSEKVLSDSQIADIRAYLASMPPGKTAAQIPLLNR